MCGLFGGTSSGVCTPPLLHGGAFTASLGDTNTVLRCYPVIHTCTSVTNSLKPKVLKHLVSSYFTRSICTSRLAVVTRVSWASKSHWCHLFQSLFIEKEKLWEPSCWSLKQIYFLKQEMWPLIVSLSIRKLFGIFVAVVRVQLNRRLISTACHFATSWFPGGV